MPEVGWQHVRQVCAEVGPPPLSAAAAFRELCGGVPGCYGMAEPEARYQRHLVSLPEPCDLCKPAQVLEGDAHDLWVHWQTRLLRSAPHDGPCVRPHSDQTLIRDREAYAQLIGDLSCRGLASVGAEACPYCRGILRLEIRPCQAQAHLGHARCERSFRGAGVHTVANCGRLGRSDSGSRQGPVPVISRC